MENSMGIAKAARGFRVGYLLRDGVMWATAAALAACSSASERPSSLEQAPALGSTHQALTGGFTDDETPDTNIVVLIDQDCTGTLITPQIVLAANHCIYGAEVAGSCRPKTPGNIRIGLSASNSPASTIAYVDA
jgi:hypothetical protein